MWCGVLGSLSPCLPLQGSLVAGGIQDSLQRGGGGGESYLQGLGSSWGTTRRDLAEPHPPACLPPLPGWKEAPCWGEKCLPRVITAAPVQ